MTALPVDDAVARGALRFARYAYPPNALGYCGPDDAPDLFAFATGEHRDRDHALAALAREFEGAWPYLELIARANGRDPLDDAVVQAYWLGNPLLYRVDPRDLAHSLDARFGARAGRDATALVRDALVAPLPQHGLHVFAVYPWTGLLRSAARDDALHVLDACRVRWGEVLDVDGDVAVVASEHLTIDEEHGRCRLAPPSTETVLAGRAGARLAARVAVGDTVALHWDWVCDVLTPAESRWLRMCTGMQLRMVDAELHAAPAALAVAHG